MTADHTLIKRDTWNLSVCQNYTCYVHVKEGNLHRGIYSRRIKMFTLYHIFNHPSGIKRKTVGQAYWQVTMKVLSKVMYMDNARFINRGTKTSTLVWSVEACRKKSQISKSRCILPWKRQRIFLSSPYLKFFLMVSYRRMTWECEECCWEFGWRKFERSSIQ